MLYKKGDRTEHDNYRPIALVNTLIKIFTQILYQRLSKWASIHRVLPEFQSGFREGRGCMDNIFTLNALIQFSLNNVKGKLFSLLVDFKRAFPSINHALLWHKLRKFGVSSKIINILISLYSQALMQVKIAHVLSKLTLQKEFCRVKYSALFCSLFSCQI